MILIRATRAAPSSLKEMGRSLTAAWKFRSPQHANRATLRGVAAFPRRPIPFLWHYVRRRPPLHFTALAAVLGAAAAACAAQYGLKLIVDAMAQGAEHMTGVWLALAVFVGLLAGESMLWRFGSWLGYRAMLVDKAEARLDLFDHLGGHSSRYFTDVMSGALASRVSSTGDSVQLVLSIVLFNIAPVCADFCAALAILATVQWQLGAALALFVLMAVGILALLGQRGTPRLRGFADRAAGVGGAVVDVVSDVRAVKAYA